MRKVNSNILVTVCVLIMTLAVPAGAVTHYVDPNGSAEFTTIQAAIDDANNGDEIEVAPGTYYEAINFSGKAVRLYSSGGPEVTTIDGTGNYHVVQCVSSEGAGTILEGFTITGGNAYGFWPDRLGGGMYNEQSSPTVTNCIFTGNSASSGGGMYNYENSSPTVTNCTFSENTATRDGGGMYNNSSSPTVTDCTFSGNTADESGGGGMCNSNSSSPTVTDCTFSGNTADESGGGMYNSNSSSPTLTNCTFSGNVAYIGGGMYNYENSSPTVTNCTFSENTATRDGGGMYNHSSSPTVTDCTFSGNTADESGGGMCNNSSSPTLTNCTFSGNVAYIGGGMYNSSSSPTVTNCILWGDTPDEIYNSSSSPVITYSDVEGSWGGAGNIDADPCFVDDSNPNPNLWNLRLTGGSPCIDAGDNTAVPSFILTDPDGNIRYADDPCTVDTGHAGITGLAVIDMGAYEFGSATPALQVLAPNGGEVASAGSTYPITWQTAGSVSDVVVEYGDVPDHFDNNDPGDYTLEDSYGSGGSLTMSGGKLYITTGSDNTASVMTSEAVRFGARETLSLEVEAVSGTEGVFMMCSTTAGQPNGTSSFGFRFRRSGGFVRIDMYPGGTVANTADPCSSKPATLRVKRTSHSGFDCSVIIEGVETQLGSFTLASLATFFDLHIGAQAYDTSSNTFVFDNLLAYSGAQWKAVWPANTGNTDSYNWLVPEELSERCLVRISQGGNLAQSDSSDELFSIKGLVGHWRLDETSGYRAYDSAGGNDGSLYGEPRWLSGGGPSGGALELDGVDDYVDCGNEVSLDITDEVTVAAWVKTSDAGNGEFNPYVTKGNFTFGLKHQDGNNIEFMIYDDDWRTVRYPVDSNFNDQWHHLAGTYDGNDLMLYVDGALEANSTHAGSIASSSSVVNIGRNSERTTRFYEGLIDDVRIYNYALSVEEIRGLLCSGPIEGDVDKNCKVDLRDFAVLASDWLTCNLPWYELCWEQ